MSVGEASKLVEGIPAVSAPVELPSLLPSEASYRAGAITGGVLFLLSLGALVAGIVVTW